MGMGKVVINGVETKFTFDIDEDEIEVNEKKLDNTIDLKEVIESINGQDTESQ